MLALHEHTCKARTDARQMSEAAVGRQVELDLAVARQHYEAELAELTQTNQRLRKALVSSLAEAAGNPTGSINMCLHSALCVPLPFTILHRVLLTAVP